MSSSGPSWRTPKPGWWWWPPRHSRPIWRPTRCWRRRPGSITSWFLTLSQARSFLQECPASVTCIRMTAPSARRLCLVSLLFLKCVSRVSNGEENYKLFYQDVGPEETMVVLWTSGTTVSLNFLMIVNFFLRRGDQREFYTLRGLCWQ